MSSLKRNFVPKMAEMMAWTTEIFNQGIRRPGYPADYSIEKWIKSQFETLNLQNIVLDPVPVKKWESFDATLKIWLIDDPNNVLEIPCFPIPYTQPTNDLEGELCMITEDTSLSGKIGIMELNLFQLPAKVLKSLPGAEKFYDPSNEFDDIT